MRKKYIVGFPVLGNYYIPIYNFLNNIVDKELVEVLMPNKITDETIVNGAKVSPDFVCVPFKYNMGNYIEAIEKAKELIGSERVGSHVNSDSINSKEIKDSITEN